VNKNPESLYRGILNVTQAELGTNGLQVKSDKHEDCIFFVKCTQRCNTHESFTLNRRIHATPTAMNLILSIIFKPVMNRYLPGACNMNPSTTHPGTLSLLAAIMMGSLFLFVLFPGTPVQAAEDLPKLVHGGKLYDNWLAFVPAPRRQQLALVRQTHPSYPKHGPKKGLTTWRCKECHGWDYRGKKIGDDQGNHTVTIIGIQRLIGADPAEVLAILRNPVHSYDQAMITDRDAEALAQFVVSGQHDFSASIDSATGSAQGEANKGAPFFQTLCAVCHGLDGRKIDFDPKEEVEYLGHVARENPYEFLHKIRFGQPGQIMIALSALTTQQQLDLLAFAQTLPRDPRDPINDHLPFDPGPKEIFPLEEQPCNN